MTSAFWILSCIIFYTYIGYSLVLWIIALFKNRLTVSNPAAGNPFEPEITLIIPAYNEEQFIEQKIQNTLALDYPREKIHVLWITDGSTDHTVSLLKNHPEIRHMHEAIRRGKVHAMNRAMKSVNTPIAVFTDANTMLNKQAIRAIIEPFSDEKTGCVTGEKRIIDQGAQDAVGAGESLYWKYESLIKQLESETGSVIGAVGELFAIRTKLYEDIKEDTLLDDFTISLLTVRKGYHTKYALNAWSVETASLSVSEERKRKIRIAAGGIQFLVRSANLLNPFRNLNAFKYFSHKVLRWIVVPFAFPCVFILNLFIITGTAHKPVYSYLFLMQCIFYGFVILGFIFEQKKIKPGIFFAPYYVYVMNVAMVQGISAYLMGNYTVNWQKAKRT